MANDFEPNKIDSNEGEEAFNRKLRQDIKATLDSVELGSRRSQIMAQIRQERANGLQPVRPPDRNRGGFRWSPALAGSLAVVVVAVALIFVVAGNNNQREATNTQANFASSNKVTPSAAQAVESGAKGAATTTAAATTTVAPMAAGAAPASTNNAPVAATTAAATTTAAAAATTMAAATRTTPAPTTAAAVANDSAILSQYALVYPSSTQISVETSKVSQFVTDFRAGLSDTERTRLDLQNISGFRYLAYNAKDVKFVNVLDFYQQQANQQQLKLETSQPRDDNKLKSQWLYLQNPANTSERYGIMLVEIKDQAAADAAFGVGKASVGDTIILFAVPN